MFCGLEIYQAYIRGTTRAKPRAEAAVISRQDTISIKSVSIKNSLTVNLMSLLIDSLISSTDFMFFDKLKITIQRDYIQGHFYRVVSLTFLICAKSNNPFGQRLVSCWRDITWDNALDTTAVSKNMAQLGIWIIRFSIPRDNKSWISEALFYYIYDLLQSHVELFTYWTL